MPDTTSTRLLEALERMRPVALALPPEKLLKPKIDISAAGAILLAALPRYETQIAELSSLKHTQAALVAELPVRAMAMVQAYAGFKVALPSANASTSAGVPGGPPAPALSDLVERGTDLRRRMLAAAHAVAAERRELQDSVDAIQRGTGHRDLAFDLVGLSLLFRGLPDTVLARTFITADTINEAQGLGDALLTAVGEKAEGSPKTTDEARLRDGTYTLFMESYNEARRGLTYLHEGKADTYLPSVFLRSTRADASSANAGSGGKPGPVPEPTDGGTVPTDHLNDGTEPGGPFAPMPG